MTIEELKEIKQILEEHTDIPNIYEEHSKVILKLIDKEIARQSVTDKVCVEHDKVYSNTILASYPPQHKWICRKCGAEGIDTIGGYIGDEYEKFKTEKQVEQSQDYNFEVGV